MKRPQHRTIHARPTEEQRAAIFDLFADIIWGTAPDHELGNHFGVSTGAVRELRAEHRRNLTHAQLASKVRELSELVRWPGEPRDLLLATVDAALASARSRDGEHRDPLMQMLREAMVERDRERAMESLSAEVSDAAE
jgi:hypothetical protein